MNAFPLCMLLMLGCLPVANVVAEEGNLVKNGNFEEFDTEWTSFENIKHWRNRGSGGQKASGRRKGLGDDQVASGHHASINDRYNDASATFGSVAHTQATGYTIRAGDSFSLHYAWRPVFGWQRDRDVVRFVLYATTGNTLNGPVVWSAPMDSGFARSNERWELVSHLIGTVPAAAVGKELFITFHGVDLKGESGQGFAAVDSIVLEALKAN